MEKKIFILDDDKLTTWALDKSLTKKGYQVLPISFSNDVMSLIIEFAPDLLLLDYVNYDIDIPELCQMLSINELTNHIPIIIMSGYNVSQIEILGSAYSYLSKPFDVKDLISKIEDLIAPALSVKHR